MKKRRLKKKFKKLFMTTGIVLAILLIGTLLYLFVFNNIHFIGVKSVNRDAKTYKTRTCLAFYPKTKDGKQIAKDLCSSTSKETIFDYALVPYGDYYLVEYGNDVHYYIDHDNNPLEINSISDEGKTILVDYLRYDMKKAEIDKAYTLEFFNETSIDNLDISNCKYDVEGQFLSVYYPQYDFTSYVPLKYIQTAANINLGYENELYAKPKYISRNRKTVAFTFDDGPSLKTSPAIIECLKENDAVATFFVLGTKLDSRTIPIIKESIENGNQYGSHTQSHQHLGNLDAETEYKEIMQPVIDIRDGFHGGTDYDFDGLGYEISIYRAPYGEHKSKDTTNAPFISIEWDCDSEDWKSRDSEYIIDKVYDFEAKNKDELDGCIVLFHDTYPETVEAIKVLVPELIKKGYQFITVDEMLNVLKIDKNRAYYPW